MGWNKLDDHTFTYNEGSLNFTLRGGAFHDDDGDGVPDGVSFENGRPVFMNIKNLKDFHFDVPRGYIIVNGNEYKLVDLDNNADNGEELQLFKENVGFPQGNDRTNPKAYKKIDAHQFTYNEGSLNYTLTGGAFNDNDGNGIPDGVQIIGPKPCFGADGKVFDTSVENFHFKVPSGALMVNGERYSLAELDNNPDDGYELVIPEKAAVDGWSIVDKPLKGWAYRRGSDNNPINKGSFRLFGDGLVDNDGDGQPDGVTVPTVILGQEVDGVRITKIGIAGLSGEVKLNHPQYGLGVFNDDNWGIEIVKHGGDLYQTIYSNISDGATVVVSSGTEIINTDGSGKINILASKSFVLNGQTIDVEGSKYFTIKLDDAGGIKNIKEEVLGWRQKGNKLEFTGRPNNDPSQKVKFTISGNGLNVDNLKVSVLRKVRGLGVRVGIEGLSGEVKLNGKPLGISNDDNYTVHFTPIVDPDIAPENVAQVKSLELLNINPGAIINSPGNWIILDGNGTYHFGDGEYFISDRPAHSRADLKKIIVNNGGKGSDVSVTDGNFDGEGISFVAGAQAVAEGVKGIADIIFDSVIEVVENVASIFDFSTAHAASKTESRSWSKVDSHTFAFSGFDDHDPESVVDFTISGKKLVDKDNDGAPDGVQIGDIRSIQAGVVVSLQGLNGEVSLNGQPLGIKNDDNYELHFAAKINDDAPLEQVAYLKTLRFLNISPGAEISAQNSCVFLEGDGQYLFADGNYRVSPVPVKVGSANQQLQNLSIDNGGRGAKVVVNGDKFGTIQYLSNYFGFDLNDLSIPQSEVSDDVDLCARQPFDDRFGTFSEILSASLESERD